MCLAVQLHKRAVMGFEPGFGWPELLVAGQRDSSPVKVVVGGVSQRAAYYDLLIGLLLLVIGGSAIYCIVKALWQSLLILVVLGIATIAAVFLLVWAVMKVENIGESLGAFIRS